MLGNAKINQYGFPSGVEENVGRFDIQVQDILLMDILQSTADLLDVFDSIYLG